MREMLLITLPSMMPCSASSENFVISAEAWGIDIGASCVAAACCHREGREEKARNDEGCLSIDDDSVGIEEVRIDALKDNDEASRIDRERRRPLRAEGSMIAQKIVYSEGQKSDKTKSDLKY